jgi:hypothetical protein
MTLLHARQQKALAEHPPPLLAPGGARIILGNQAVPIPVPVAPSAGSLFGPRGVCLAGPFGPLVVCDSGHHRLLLWQSLPQTDNQPADFLIGQPHFNREARNGGGEVGPATFSVPTGVASSGRCLAVADAWNHRVLVWHDLPLASNRPADIVVGQADFTAAVPNRGEAQPSAASLNWCYGVAIHDGRLFVADTGNRRVLIWQRLPETNGVAADLVLGQHDFTARDEGAGASIDAVGMRWPHAIAVAGEHLLVADAGSSRIMVWRRLPQRNSLPCDFVLGQPDSASGDHNRSAYAPTAASFNMPYGLAAAGGQLLVADTANSRLTGFDLSRLQMGAAANRLCGQEAFSDKGDNRWGPARRDSLCWPYGVHAHGPTIAIADSGNNRVLLWDAA